MQTIAHTPPHAQHVPDGWGFPTLTAVVPPAPVAPGPVRGGGAASTATRVRWGRILLLLVGVSLVAFGAWRATASSSSGSARSVSGSGTAEVEVVPADGAEDGAAEATPTDSAADGAVDAAADETATDATTPTVMPPAAAAPRATPRPGAANGRRPARRAAAGAAAVNGFTAAPAVAAPGAGAAGGGAPAGQLPVTGLETWIAAGLGVLVLALGIAIQVNAVRIGMTAMLYRRGILLRPVDCARLAQERGLSQLRVLLSNALHRLLEEPAGGSDFVRVRPAR